jgi:hypothetical protein
MGYEMAFFESSCRYYELICFSVEDNGITVIHNIVCMSVMLLPPFPKKRVKLLRFCDQFLAMKGIIDVLPLLATKPVAANTLFGVLDTKFWTNCSQCLLSLPFSFFFTK